MPWIDSTFIYLAIVHEVDQVSNYSIENYKKRARTHTIR